MVIIRLFPVVVVVISVVVGATSVSSALCSLSVLGFMLALGTISRFGLVTPP